MPLNDLLSETSIIGSLRASSKDQAFEQISRAIARLHRLEEHQLLETLREREALGSTGVGQGVAIPHAKLKTVERVFGFFARLEKPVEFGAPDGEPVDLMFVLVAPENAGADHLRALANSARILRDASMTAKLRATADATALYLLLVGAGRSHAA